MLQFIFLMLVLAQPAAGSRAARTGPDPLPGPRPVTDKDVLGWSSAVPQCGDHGQEQRVMEERMKGLPEECVVVARKRERSADRQAAKLDQSQPHP